MVAMQKRKARKPLNSDTVFHILVTCAAVFCLLIVLYPLWFCVIASISNATDVSAGRVLLLPKHVNTTGYRYMFMDKRIMTGYSNTLVYTLGTTLLGLFLTIPAGYALSRPGVPGTKFVMKYMVFTMYFGGGLVPTYLIVKNLGLIDNRFTVVLMCSFSVYNLLVARTFFANSLPQELWEAASIDGCTQGRFFVSIVVPLSKAIIAVIALYYCVSQWNDFMTSLIYLNSQKKYSLQTFLREILVAGQNIAAESTDPDELREAMSYAQTIKYCVIIVATLPMLMIYPFIQRFFVQGVMLGSIKG